MIHYTRQSATKEMRLAAKKVGLTFKPMRYMRINGFRAFEFCDRQTGLAKFSNCTFSSAYENVCSGFISTYDKTLGVFK